MSDLAKLVEMYLKNYPQIQCSRDFWGNYVFVVGDSYFKFNSFAESCGTMYKYVQYLDGSHKSYVVTGYCIEKLEAYLDKWFEDAKTLNPLG